METDNKPRPKDLENFYEMVKLVAKGKPKRKKKSNDSAKVV